ncbi:hypothetical protein [Zobellia roscoffensis]|uniref:hypothetical protein n=1 Tax=Zobellia roscoffensis TaxID=2779508 RepID=UPI00188A312D|nr:hypothetical protein [Zobellia roscoffensis]
MSGGEKSTENKYGSQILLHNQVTNKTNLIFEFVTETERVKKSTSKLAFAIKFKGYIEVKKVLLKEFHKDIPVTNIEDIKNLVTKETIRKVGKNLSTKTTKHLLPLNLNKFYKLFEDFLLLGNETKFLKNLDQFYLTTRKGIIVSGNIEIDFGVPEINVMPERSFYKLKWKLSIYLFFLTIPIETETFKLNIRGHEIQFSFVGEALIDVGVSYDLLKAIIKQGIKRNLLPESSVTLYKKYSMPIYKKIMNLVSAARLGFSLIGSFGGLLAAIGITTALIGISYAMFDEISKAHSRGEAEARLLAYSNAFVARLLWSPSILKIKTEDVITSKSELYKYYQNLSIFHNSGKFHKNHLEGLNNAHRLSLEFPKISDHDILLGFMLPAIRNVDERYFRNINKYAAQKDIKLVWKNFYLGYSKLIKIS